MRITNGDIRMTQDNTQEPHYAQMYGLVQKAKTIVTEVANSIIPYKINTFNISYSVEVTQGYSSIPILTLYIKLHDSTIVNFKRIIGVTVAMDAIVGMPAEYLEKGWEYLRDSTSRAIEQAVITIIKCIVTNNYKLLDDLSK